MMAKIRIWRIGFFDEQQKKYKISDNSIVVKALR